MNRTLRLTHTLARTLPGLALTLALAAGSAGAQATITVNSTVQVVAPTAPSGNNDGMCSLSEAIVAANTNSAVDTCTAGQSGGTDTIMLPAGTYTLSTVDNNSFGFGPTGLPVILAPVLIQGAAAATTIIERSTVAGTPAMRAFFFQDALTLNNLTVRNFAGANGAVAYARGGQFITNDCVLTGNDGTPSVFFSNFTVPATFNNTVITNNTSGGAILSNGNLTLNNTTVSNNSHNTNVIIGGNTLGSGTIVTITDSTISNNTCMGGCSPGVQWIGGTLIVTRSVFSGNSGSSATVGGGGLAIVGENNGGGQATITDSIFSGNTLSSGLGGGISITNPSLVTISGSLITGNSLLSGGLGGGIGISRTACCSFPIITIRNSTISGNSNSTGRGGGVGIGDLNASSLTLNNVTVTNNTAGVTSGGVDQTAAGTVTLSNTIIAGNSGPGSAPDCFGNFASQGFNLVGTDNCLAPPQASDQVGTLANPINALLAGLANNSSTVMAGSNVGGSVPIAIQTHGLLTGSPALNMGNSATPLDGLGGRCEATDQRGVPRPGGAQCDIGAFEDQTGAGVAANFDLSVTKADAPDPVLVNNNLTYTITVANGGPDVAPAVTLTDTLPLGLSFVSATPSNAPAGSCSGTTTVTCNLGAINSGANVTVTIVVTVTGAAVSPLSNTASASGTGNDTNTANNSDTSSTVITGLQADLALTKSDAPDPTILGAGNITYTLTVANGGPANATNVMLSDTLPGNATFVSATPSQGSCPAPSGGVLTCNLGTINNGANATVTVVVTPTATGAVNNSASVSATESDPSLANNSATASTTVNAQADLSVTKTDAPDPINLGAGNVTYTVTVANAGPSPATNVVLTDTLPAGVTFVSATAPCTQTGGTVTCNLGTLASGANSVITIVITPTAAGTLNNSATVAAAEPDPNAANNTAAASTTVNPSADVSVAVSDAPDPVNAGANVTYTVTVSNAGPSPATAVMLTNTLPANVTFVSSTPSAGTCNAPAAGSFTCNLGTINSGASATVAVVVTTTGATAANITNSATVSAAEFDPVAANNSASASTTVTPVANLGVTVTDAPDPVAQGSNITYTVTVTNAGPSSATSVTATVPVPANVTFVSGTATQGTCAVASGTITCTIGTMASGATVTATIVVTATAAGTVNASITVASPVLDPTPGNNSASASTTVNAPASADFTIAASPASASLQGNQQSATFTLTLAPTPAGSSFTSAINLTCFSTPPAAVICSANPNAVTPNNAAATSILTVTRVVNAPPPGNSGAAPRHWPGLPGGTVPVLLAMLGLLAWRRARRDSFAPLVPLPAPLRGLRAGVSVALLLAVGLLLTQAGCRSDSPPAFRGPVQVTVTGTSGSISHSTTVTITVQ
jgi:uncharacterized repeat protein (TIGR01451 family)